RLRRGTHKPNLPNRWHTSPTAADPAGLGSKKSNARSKHCTKSTAIGKSDFLVSISLFLVSKSDFLVSISLLLVSKSDFLVWIPLFLIRKGSKETLCLLPRHLAYLF